MAKEAVGPKFSAAAMCRAQALTSTLPIIGVGLNACAGR